VPPVPVLAALRPPEPLLGPQGHQRIDAGGPKRGPQAGEQRRDDEGEQHGGHGRWVRHPLREPAPLKQRD